MGRGSFVCHTRPATEPHRARAVANLTVQLVSALAEALDIDDEAPSM
jgi:hypothetical protein